MAGKCLGIEVGAHNLKIIECNTKSGAITSTAVAQILPDAIVQNGRIMAYNAMGSLLRETLRDHKIRTSAASIVLPMDSYFIKRVQLPVMTVKQLQINLPYEFHDYINDDMSHYVYDYAVLGIHKAAAAQDASAAAGSASGNGQTPQSDVMDLMIAACPKELVANYGVMCRRAGLKLVKLVPDVLALQTLVFPPDEYEKRIAAETAAEKEEQKRARAQEKATAREQNRRHARKDKAVEEELERLGAVVPGSSAENAADAMTGSGQNAGAAPSNGGGSAQPAAAGTAAPGEGSGHKEPEWQDYAILDFGHTGTRLHFFSNGAYEITRTMTTNARTVAELLAQKRGVDIHIAELMLANNQDNVLQDPQVVDAYDTMATEIQRVMNFYSYSNPHNTIDRIYYFGDGLNAAEMGSRIHDAIGLELHPVTELIPAAGDAGSELLLAPQAYGAVFE